METDGTIGALLSTNILNWSLTLTSSGLAGGSPDTISGTSATLVLGSGLIGSLTDLVFDFSDSSSAFVLRGTDFNGWCLISSSFTCAGTAGPSEGIFFGASGGTAESASRSGRVVIAAASTVPEPATLALLGMGLAGVAFSRRRSKA